MPTRTKYELDSGAVVIPGQSHCPGVKSRGGGGGGGGQSVAALTILWMVEGPVPLLWLLHQKYFLFSKVLMNALSSLLSDSFGGLAIPCPLIDSPLLLVSRFLGRHFLGGLFLACWFQLVDLDSNAPMFLFQRIDLCSHCHDLFLFFSGLAPSVLFVKESSLIFVLCVHYEVFSHEGGSPIVTLAF